MEKKQKKSHFTSKGYPREYTVLKFKTRSKRYDNMLFNLYKLFYALVYPNRLLLQKGYEGDHKVLHVNFCYVYKDVYELYKEGEERAIECNRTKMAKAGFPMIAVRHAEQHTHTPAAFSPATINESETQSGYRSGTEMPVQSTHVNQPVREKPTMMTEDESLDPLQKKFLKDYPHFSSAEVIYNGFSENKFRIPKEFIIETFSLPYNDFWRSRKAKRRIRLLTEAHCKEHPDHLIGCVKSTEKAAENRSGVKTRYYKVYWYYKRPEETPPAHHNGSH